MTNLTRTATLVWSGRGLVFEGTYGGDGPPLTIDGDSHEGPSPMEALLLSIGGCMGIDIQVILEKGRVPLERLSLSLEGDRAPEAPKRFLRVRMVVEVEGPAPEDLGKVERAIELSRDKYCSVLNTLAPDLEFTTRIVRS